MISYLCIITAPLIVVCAVLIFFSSNSKYRKLCPNHKIKDDECCDIEFGVHKDSSIEYSVIRQRNSVSNKDQMSDISAKKQHKEYSILPRPNGVNQGHNGVTQGLLKHTNVVNNCDFINTNHTNNSVDAKIDNPIEVRFKYYTEVANHLLNSRPLVDLTLDNNKTCITNNTINSSNDMRYQSSLNHSCLITSVALKDLR